MNLLEQNR